MRIITRHVYVCMCLCMMIPHNTYTYVFIQHYIKLFIASSEALSLITIFVIVA